MAEYNYPSLSENTINNAFLVQARFVGPSGLPEDVFVMTTFWRDDAGAGGDAVAAAVSTAWDDLMLEQIPSASTFVRDYVPDEIGGPFCTAYDLSVLPPRVPYENTSTNAPPNGGAEALPREVAITCSYHNGGPGPRNRGRFYFGPLTVEATTAVQDQGRVDVDANLRNGLSNALQKWIDTPPTGVTWMQLSRANMAMYPVGGGWIDNAFDTQRRRGKAPTARTKYGVDPTTGVGGPPGGKGTEFRVE